MSRAAKLKDIGEAAWNGKENSRYARCARPAASESNGEIVDVTPDGARGLASVFAALRRDWLPGVLSVTPTGFRNGLRQNWKTRLQGRSAIFKPGENFGPGVDYDMKIMKLIFRLCLFTLLMTARQSTASILVDYFRCPPAERERLTKDGATWDKFELDLVTSQSKAMRDALDKLKLDGLSKEERLAKIGAAIKQSRNPAHFNMEKDWQIIAYLLTGDAKIKEENVPNAPLHNVIFGGIKTAAISGYGPVRYFDAKSVGEIAAALASADRKAIAARYDPDTMKKLDIYAPPEANEKKAILQVIDDLTAFFQKAAAAKEDVITFAW